MRCEAKTEAAAGDNCHDGKNATHPGLHLRLLLFYSTLPEAMLETAKHRLNS
jgi:hypothetical protein